MGFEGYEGREKITHGIKATRGLSNEQVIGVLGSIAGFVNDPQVEVRSNNHPVRRPALHLLPQGWFREKHLPQGMSFPEFRECFFEDRPSLLGHLSLTVNLRLMHTKNGHFIIAESNNPAVQQKIREERNSVISTGRRVLCANAVPDKVFYDATLAFMRPNASRSLLAGLEGAIDALPEYDIELEPLQIERYIPDISVATALNLTKTTLQT
jgi:hypothetical protein